MLNMKESEGLSISSVKYILIRECDNDLTV